MSLYDTFREMLTEAVEDPETAQELLDGSYVPQEVQRWEFWYQDGVVSLGEYVTFLDETYEACK